MLKGFEDQTKELSDKEKVLARIIWRYLNNAFTSNESITNSQLSRKLKADTGEKLSGSRIRKIINWMHTHGHLPGLIASSKGYAQARSIEQLSDYEDSLKGRLKAIQGRLIAVRRDINSFTQTELTFKN
jgi:hypothetical protein